MCMCMCACACACVHVHVHVHVMPYVMFHHLTIMVFKFIFHHVHGVMCIQLSIHAPKRLNDSKFVLTFTALDLADLLSTVWVRRRCRRRQEDRREEGGAAEQPLRPHGLAQQ
jgi:hypothetical protein